VLRAAAAAGGGPHRHRAVYGADTVNELIREALYPYPDGLAIVSKVGARRDAGGVLRSWEARQLRPGIEDNLRALGTGQLAAVNLRMMDPSHTPGRRRWFGVVLGPTPRTGVDQALRQRQALVSNSPKMAGNWTRAASQTWPMDAQYPLPW
jgi:aryl-alcohol dehydrogenase-like predicted oxidoreductase